MRRLAFALIAIVLSLATSAAQLADETLHYKVMYKWGLINKCAGYATLSLHGSGNNYKATLIGRSAPWADKIFMLRDTLTSLMHNDFRPVRYEKIAHEGKEHKHDVVDFEYVGRKVVGNCWRRKVVKDKLEDDFKMQLEAEGVVVDMLSSFYYMRMLPFDSWQPGHSDRITIFSGKQKEWLTLEYKGLESVTIDGVEHKCYHITFIFTGDNGKKTSDDMNAWISADSSRRALKLVGELPIGQIQCLLTN